MRLRHFVSLALGGALVALVALPHPVRAQQVELKPKEKEKVKRDRSVVTADEIAEHPDLNNAYDLIKSLRSQWLRVVRGSGRALSGADAMKPPDNPGTSLTKGCAPSCPTGEGGSSGPVPHESGSPYAESGATTLSPGRAGPVLYLNEIKQEGLDDLKNIRTSDIMEMRYMTGTEASGRYGAGHESGAILIKLKTKGGT